MNKHKHTPTWMDAAGGTLATIRVVYACDDCGALLPYPPANDGEPGTALHAQIAHEKMLAEVLADTIRLWEPGPTRRQLEESAIEGYSSNLCDPHAGSLADWCATHGEPLICPHVCQLGQCEPCEGKTDHEPRGEL